MFEGALDVEGLDVMRIAKILLLASSITTASVASAESVTPPAPATPPLHLSAWKSDFTTMANEHVSDLPPVLAPMDHATSDIPQDVPVEAVPTPTAVTSGLLVLGALASVRLVRRLWMA